MQLRNSATIEASPYDVWVAIGTPSVVARCLPGFTLLKNEGEGFEGAFGVKLGPITLTYKGKGSRTYRNPIARRMTFEWSGRDSRGNGTLSATLDAGLWQEEVERTRIELIADITVTGRPAQYGRGVLNDTVQKTLDDFAEQLTSLLKSNDVQVPENHHQRQRRIEYHETPALPRLTPASPPPGSPASDNPIARWTSRWARKSVFVSYARRDEDAVRPVVEDLRAARVTVWLDEELETGEVWWEEILRRIREAAVFVHALSDASLASAPCRAEREYAEALGIPIVPVQVGPADLRTAADGMRQVIDYRDRAPRKVARLIGDVVRHQLTHGPLKDPLPEPPPVPFGNLLRIRTELRAVEIATADQQRILDELARYLDDDAAADVRTTVVALLTTLADHGTTINRVRRMARGLIGE